MKRLCVPAVLAALSALLVLVIGSQGAGAAKTAAAVGSGKKVVLFSSDGMRPDLMNRYVAEGAMPTYAALRTAGVEGQNGMIQAFPPNTGVGWYTMATGTYPSEQVRHRSASPIKLPPSRTRRPGRMRPQARFLRRRRR